MPKISVGTSPVSVVAQNISRVKIFLQNVGESKIYCTKQKNGAVRSPSLTDYDFMLVPIKEAGQSDNIKEASSVSEKEIYSIGGIKAISEDKGSELAYFETEEVSV